MSKILESQKKILVWEDVDFIVTTPLIPHISKNDGGHLIVSPKVNVSEIYELDDVKLLRFMRIVAVCTQSLKSVLGEQGINIPFTNNQDNGNWAVLNDRPKSLHFHIYGRARNSIKQVFGQAIFAPDPHSTFYDNNIPLNTQDIKNVNNYISMHLG